MKIPDFIPLLSGRSLSEFRPLEFLEYVKSLNGTQGHKRLAKMKAKKSPKEFSWSLNKKGTLLLRVRRSPKFLTRAEIAQIAAESGVPENIVFLKVKNSTAEIEIRP
jgi:hypothetical protein